jgi:hypothetical protein
MLMYFFAGLFWISSYAWPNSRYRCCLFLTLRISLISDMLQGRTFVLTARHRKNCAHSFCIEPSGNSLVPERARRGYWASPNTLTDDALRWTGYYLWADSKESAYSWYHQCRLSVMGYKLDGQVHRLPKISSGMNCLFYSHTSFKCLCMPKWIFCKTLLMVFKL